jgi:hypothetical protein
MSTETETTVDPSMQSVAATANNLRQTMGAVKLSFSWLGTQRKLSDAQTKQAADTFDAATDLVTASKRLIDTKHPAYRAATAIKSQASAFWRGMTLPYPQDGTRLIKLDDIERFETQMAVYKEQLAAATANLQLEYETIKSNAREKLGSLYNPSDYPATLDGVFDISWEYPPVEPPRYLVALNPEVYSNEQRRIQTRFETAVAMAENAFAETLQGLVTHLIERLTDAPDGKKKTFRDGTIENFKEFYENFRRMNVRSNVQLEQLINQANLLVAGVDPKELRTNVNLQTQLRTQMSDLKVSLDTLITEAPRRRVMPLES